MTQYADRGDYTWPLDDNERLSELVGGGGALYDVPPVVSKDATNTVFVPARDALRNGGGPVTVHDVRYDMRTCNDRHTEEMGKLWAALVHLQRRIEQLESFNQPGK